jgi:hypothetical protein
MGSISTKAKTVYGAIGRAVDKRRESKLLPRIAEPGFGQRSMTSFQVEQKVRLASFKHGERPKTILDSDFKSSSPVHVVNKKLPQPSDAGYRTGNASTQNQTFSVKQSVLGNSNLDDWSKESAVTASKCFQFLDIDNFSVRPGVVTERLDIAESQKNMM